MSSDSSTYRALRRHAALSGMMARAASVLPGVQVRAAGRAGQSPAVYLTFDDGPVDETGHVLELLAQRGVGATFFLLGERLGQRAGLVDRMLRDGHTIGTHGFSHKSAWQAPFDASENMARGAHALEEMTGQRCAIARPPYGRLSPSLLHWARRTHRQLVLWDVDAVDYRAGDYRAGDYRAGDYRAGAAAQASVRLVRDQVRPGSIVLLHEAAPAWRGDSNGLAGLVDGLLADGYRLEAL